MSITTVVYIQYDLHLNVFQEEKTAQFGGMQPYLCPTEDITERLNSAAKSWDWKWSPRFP